jgi:hypothetical protein
MGLRRFSCRAARVLALAVFAVVAAGCSDGGGSLSPVKGKVNYKGKAAAGAQVTFFPEGKEGDMGVTPASGTTDADGVFTLSTGKQAGVKPGKYVVTVIFPDPNKKISEQDKMMGLGDAPDLLKGRYATTQSSTLKAEVKGGENVLEPFEVN